MTTPTADTLRSEGNALFKSGRYSEAEERYAAAIAALAGAPESEEARKCRLNRCACLLRLHGYEAARREAETVIEQSGGTAAKAHFRLGQCLDALHEPQAAAAALTQAIKLDPKAREPREALEAVRARLKAQPQLELVLDDLRLVEERALRALCHSDLSRSRQQLELMLKQARAQAGTLGRDAGHWEGRALLGLALVCVDEGEAAAAADYIAACRRRLPAEDAARQDARLEGALALVSAAVALETEQLVEAEEHVAAGLSLARSTRSDALLLRLLGTSSAPPGRLCGGLAVAAAGTEARGPASIGAARAARAVGRGGGGGEGGPRRGGRERRQPWPRRLPAGARGVTAGAAARRRRRRSAARRLRGGARARPRARAVGGALELRAPPARARHRARPRRVCHRQARQGADTS